MVGMYVCVSQGCLWALACSLSPAHSETLLPPEDSPPTASEMEDSVCAGHLRFRGVGLQQTHSILACPLTHRGPLLPYSEPTESHAKQLALCVLPGSPHKALAMGRAPGHWRRVTAHPWGPSMLLQTLSSTGKLATQVQVLTRAQLTMGWWINPLSFQVPPGQVGIDQH